MFSDVNNSSPAEIHVSTSTFVAAPGIDLIIGWKRRVEYAIVVRFRISIHIWKLRPVSGVG